MAELMQTHGSSLAGKTILVTGAGRGLGHGVARGLASREATVIAVARTESELRELAKTVQSTGGTIETHVVDLASAVETANLAAALLARHGGVDALINNAAILRLTSFRDLSEADFEETIAVNLLAPVRLTRALLPAMLERGRGAIVNVSSAAGIKPFADETDYCAAKYGLEGFSYSLAIELAPRNVSVNLVSPGYRIKPTSVTAAEFASWPAERQAEFRDPIAMADAFAFLALQYPREGGITGQRFDAFALANELSAISYQLSARSPSESSCECHRVSGDDRQKLIADSYDRRESTREDPRHQAPGGSGQRLRRRARAVSALPRCRSRYKAAQSGQGRIA